MMKYLFVVLFPILLLTPICNTQEYTQWGLPDGAYARIGKGNITASIVKFMHDGQTLASWDYHTPMQLWNAKTGKHIKTFTGDIFAISSDGKTVSGGFKN